MTTPNSQHHRVSVFYPTDDGPDRWVNIDPVSYAMTTITFDHHKIHQGDSYIVGGTTTLNLGATFDVLITTPDTTKWTHMLFILNSSGAATVTLFEAVTTSAAGAAVDEINRNRNSANTAAVVVTTGPTVTDTGTTLLALALGAGQNTGGELRGANEWILKRNTVYLLRITSAAAANVINYMLDWYEHTSEE